MSKVRYAEIDENSRKSLQINVDGRNEDNRIRVKLFLNNSGEEVLPTK